jgi:membrane protein DedA with SNARE-associated domain
VAGSSRYSATKFLLLNSVACLLWVGVIFGAGYVLGESNQVRSLMGIIAGSIIVVLAGPLIFRIVRDRKRQTPQANVPVSDTDSPSTQ